MFEKKNNHVLFLFLLSYYIKWDYICQIYINEFVTVLGQIINLETII